MSLHDVPTEPGCGRDGAFEVDCVAHRQLTDGRAQQRLGHYIDGECVGGGTNDGETDPGHRDRVAVRHVRGDLGSPHGEPCGTVVSGPVGAGGHLQVNDLPAFLDNPGEHVSDPLDARATRPQLCCPYSPMTPHGFLSRTRCRRSTDRPPRTLTPRSERRYSSAAPECRTVR